MKLIYYCTIFCLFSLGLFAQDNRSEFVEKGDLVYATYYYENGQIEQQGTFNLKGKLHGEWVSYDLEGNKISIGTYVNGHKDGKWFFWSNGKVKEVDYKNSKIIKVRDCNDKTVLAF